MAFEDVVQESVCFVYFCCKIRLIVLILHILSCFLNKGMCNRIDTSFFPKKLNLFTKLVYKQIGEALQSVK